MGNTKIFYLCNRERCDKCSYPVCKHTDDIRYAVNFEKSLKFVHPFTDDEEEQYWEVEK